MSDRPIGDLTTPARLATEVVHVDPQTGLPYSAATPQTVELGTTAAAQIGAVGETAYAGSGSKGLNGLLKGIYNALGILSATGASAANVQGAVPTGSTTPTNPILAAGWTINGAMRRLRVDDGGTLINTYYWNETATPLSGGATFTGAARAAFTAGECGHSKFNAFFLADQAGVASIETQDAGSNWVVTASQALVAGAPLTLSVPVMTRMHRAKLVNGGAGQGAFACNTSFTGA